MHVLAYIDPGTGSLIIQTLIAAVVSVPIMFRRAIGRTIRRMRGNQPQQSSQRDSGE